MLPKRWDRTSTPPLCSPPVKPLPLYPLGRAHMFLVGCCFHSLSGGQLSIIFCRSVRGPKRRANIALHTFHPGHASSQIPSPPLTLSFGWLLCQIVERQLSKANTPPVSLFFDVCCFVTPNKGTSRQDCEPSAGRLHQTYREHWRNDLGALLPYPWRESKASG